MSRLFTPLALGAVLLLLPATAGCMVERPTPRTVGDMGLTLFVRNETNREVAVLIDGEEILRVPPGLRIRDRMVVLPARASYTVEARTAAGYVLGSFTTDVKAWFGEPGFVENTRCGDIWVWVGNDVSAEIAPVLPELQEPCE